MAPSTLRPVLQAAERAEDPSIILRNAISLIEQTANDIARMTRGITTATPERRRFREAFEEAFSDFIKATASPDAAATYTMPEATLLRLLAQSPAAQVAQAAEPETQTGEQANG